MLAKFAAAVVVFAKAINDEQEVNKQAGEKRGEEEEEGISYFQLKAQIDGIIGQSYPEVLKYYRYCVNNGHKHFTWTGPPLEIVPRSAAWNSVVQHTTTGEQLDLSSCLIYNPPATVPTTSISIPSFLFTTPKCRRSTDMDDQQTKKHKI